ncbi:chitin binding protein [Pyrrhoderma noxium]|uniref:Chitin binding protein n=1 Tax=Pyrrhoderma noxium TaxID=2282107 RepID=A0A286UFG9_9AGAM|nr:chitin binding protein [Pyrrhoderma noxium]
MHNFSTFSKIFTVACVIIRVLGHGVVTTPTPRSYGDVAKSGCGTAVYNVLTSDLTGPIENAVAKINDDYDASECELYFCRATRIEDNKGNIRTYTAGEVVNFKINLVAHHTGYANVSIVDLTTQKPIGDPIFNWPVYANQSLGPADWPKNETDFDVTIPDLGGRCTEIGLCAIQWWW